MHHVVLYVHDHELAEIAATGIRVAAGWNVEIDLDAFAAALKSNSVYAILGIVLQPGKSLREMCDGLQVAKTESTLICSPKLIHRK